jgi:hypothetical protein
MSRYADISPEEHAQDEDPPQEHRRALAFRPLDLAWQDQEAKLWSDHEPYLDTYASGHFGHLNGLSERSEC